MTIQASSKSIIFRRAWLTVAVLIFSVLQNTDGLFPQILGVRALILIPLITATAMFERDIAGMIYGLFAGLLWDIFASGNNFNAIFFLTAGFVCGTLINTIMRNNFVTHILLTAITTAVYCLGYWIFHCVVPGTGGVFYMLMRFYVPEFIYTLILSPFIFFMVMAIERCFRKN